MQAGKAIGDRLIFCFCCSSCAAHPTSWQCYSPFVSREERKAKEKAPTKTLADALKALFCGRAYSAFFRSGWCESMLMNCSVRVKSWLSTDSMNAWYRR